MSEEIKDLEQKAFDAALHAEETHGGCAQCVIAALMETVGGIPKETFKAASGMAAGVARQGQVCGAVTGSIMALGNYYGRDYDTWDADAKDKTFALCYKVLDRFKAEYGSYICKDIQTKLIGRPYKMYDAADNAAFNEDGGHRPENCPSVCGRAARWVVEIMREEGYFD